MKLIRSPLVALSATFVAAACSPGGLRSATHEAPPRSPPPSSSPSSSPVTERVTTTEASVRILAAQCERHEECVVPADEDGEGTVHACEVTQKTEIESNFATNPSCLRGVSVAGLEECLTTIREGACPYDIVHTESCRSASLCVD